MVTGSRYCAHDGQFADVQHEAAVAGDQHGAAFSGDGGADGQRQPRPDGAGGRVHGGARFQYRQHLVAPQVGGHRAVAHQASSARRPGADFLHDRDVVRADQVAQPRLHGSARRSGSLCPRPPFTDNAGVGVTAAVGQRGGERGQAGGGVRHHRQLRRVDAVYHARVGVEVDQLAAERRVVARLGTHLQARAHRQHHVRLLAQRANLRVVDQVAEAQRVVVGQAAAAVGAQQHWCAEQFGQRAQFRGRTGRTLRAAAAQHAAAGDDERAHRPGQQRRGGVHRRGVRLHRGRHGHRRLLRGRDLAVGVLQVDRDLDAARLRTAGQDVLDHAHQRRGNLLAQPHCLDPPAHGREHRRLVVRLVHEAAPLAEVGGVGLAGDHQHRRRCEAGLVQPGQPVGGAGAGAGHRHAEPAGGAGVAVGGMHGGLLVAHRHRGDPAGALDGVVDRQVVHAHHAEYMGDPRPY